MRVLWLHASLGLVESESALNLQTWVCIVWGIVWLDTRDAKLRRKFEVTWSTSHGVVVTYAYLVLSPYTRMNSPLPLPPPSASRRSWGIFLLDTLRCFMTYFDHIAHFHLHAPTLTWVDDARSDKDAMHCADVEGKGRAHPLSPPQDPCACIASRYVVLYSFEDTYSPHALLSTYPASSVKYSHLTHHKVIMTMSEEKQQHLQQH